MTKSLRDRVFTIVGSTAKSFASAIKTSGSRTSERLVRLRKRSDRYRDVQSYQRRDCDSRNSRADFSPRLSPTHGCFNSQSAPRDARSFLILMHTTHAHAIRNVRRRPRAFQQFWVEPMVADIIQNGVCCDSRIQSDIRMTDVLRNPSFPKIARDTLERSW